MHFTAFYDKYRIHIIHVVIPNIITPKPFLNHRVILILPFNTHNTSNIFNKNLISTNQSKITALLTLHMFGSSYDTFLLGFLVDSDLNQFTDLEDWHDRCNVWSGCSLFLYTWSHLLWRYYYHYFFFYFFLVLPFKSVTFFTLCTL